MADAHFEVPRLARLYDTLDPDRSDLLVYLALVHELGARHVLDVGCGTGTFACLLAKEGVAATGLDPARASLDVARAKPGAERVRWVHGDVDALPELEVDLVTMTGNVAQVFVTDDEWSRTLARCHRALRAGGHLVFDSRVPEDEAWLRWTPEETFARVDVAGVGPVQYWVEVTGVLPGVVSFRSTYVFEADGARYESDSTLRFCSRDQLGTALADAGFEVVEVRDAPDRPGRELVFLARRPADSGDSS